MASTVKVPLLGPTNKGTVVGITIGGFAIAGFMIYRYEKKAKAAAAATTAAQAASAYGYGSAAYAYGYGAGATGYYGYGEPQNDYGYGASGGFYPQGYYGYGTPEPTGTPTGNVPATTNAQWAQAAINQLTSEGYDAQTVSAALGAYELGQPVTASQVSIIQAAIGIEGYPPDSGSDGYPPAIKSQGTTGGGTGGGQGGGGTTVTVPKVTGMHSAPALKALTKAGLTGHLSQQTPKGSVGHVVSQTPAAGKKVASGSTVDLGVNITK
jgi:hypothetical protein